MKNFFVLTFLFLVIQFERPVFGINQEVDAVVGKKLDIPATKISGGLLDCQAIFHGSKEDKLYQVHPNEHPQSISHLGSWATSCGFTFIKFPAEHSGKWTIKTSYKSNGIIKKIEDILFVYETQKVKVLPATTIYVEENQYVTLYMEEINTYQSNTCILKKEEVEYDLKNLSKNDYQLELYGKCGVRMLIVDSKQHGPWLLLSMFGYKKFITEFEIEVSNKKHISNQINKYYERWNQGSINEKIRLLSVSGIIYCEVERPDGYIIVLKTPDCIYNVDIVSTVHEGVWIIRYGLKHSMELVEEHYNIEVWDSQNINVTVINDKNKNSIHMLCEVGVEALRQCMFIKPDGTKKVLPAAVGNNKYEYYGTGYEKADRKAQCGLTIHKPTSDDYGVWKCSMTTVNSNTLTALVNINLLIDQKNFDKHHLRIIKEPTYVKYGDNFELKCSVDMQLDYCWMLSPNGTIYSVTKNKNSTNSLQYSGKGLSLGICGAIVENADKTHSGSWSCHLGVHGYTTEVESTIQVTVTDSYLIPSAKNIDGSTELLCRLFPNADAEIDYCRWVNPDGNGLYQNDLIKYNIKQNKNNCSLQFKYGDIIDVGNWKCYARLTSGSDEEYHADIHYTPSTSRLSYLAYRSFTFNFLVLSVLLCFCATTALFFYKNKQFKNLSNTLPLKLPTSYSQSYNISEKNYPAKKNIES